MITLITGNIGSGKTLYAVQQIEKNLSNYDLIFTNIEGIEPNFFWNSQNEKIKLFDILLTRESFIEFCFERRNNSDAISQLIVLDEAHFTFYNDRKNIDLEFIKFLSYSRHYGIDFIFICQKPAQLHYQVRHLVNEMVYLRRKYQTGLVNIIRTENVEFDTNTFEIHRKIKNGEATLERTFLNKKYFDAYNSANNSKIKNKSSTLTTTTKLKLVLYLMLPIFLGLALSNLIDRVNKGEPLIDVSPHSVRPEP